jgi:transcriptional regulator with XRE-family HTH domain
MCRCQPPVDVPASRDHYYDAVDTLGSRIRQRLDELGRKPVWLAGQLEADQRSVERWLSDVTKPRVDQLFPIADALGVDARWLMTGEKEPTGEQSGEQSESEPSEPADDKRVDLDEALELRDGSRAPPARRRGRARRRPGGTPGRG